MIQLNQLKSNLFKQFNNLYNNQLNPGKENSLSY